MFNLTPKSILLKLQYLISQNLNVKANFTESTAITDAFKMLCDSSDSTLARICK